MHKILFITNVLSPYRANFFSEWGKSCELTIIAAQDSVKSRDKKWKPTEFANYQYISLHARPFRHDDTSLSLRLIKYLFKYGETFDFIIFGVYTDPTEILGILFCQLKGYPYLISDDGGFFTDSMLSVKRRLLAKSKAYLTTSQIAKEALKKIGVSENKISIYPFSSIRLNQILSPENRLELHNQCREELNLTDKKMILCIGQFIHRKGIDVLLKSLNNEDFHDVDVFIIGGLPTEEYEEIISEKNLQNVHFCPFMLPDNLDKYYKAADCFVLPTREDVWGLVINEAIARGLPIITTDMCLAGQEIVKDGINGYLVPAEDESALRDAMLKIVHDDDLRERMSKESLKIAKEYTIETMANAYQKQIDSLSN